MSAVQCRLIFRLVSAKQGQQPFRNNVANVPSTTKPLDTDNNLLTLHVLRLCFSNFDLRQAIPKEMSVIPVMTITAKYVSPLNNFIFYTVFLT